MKQNNNYKSEDVIKELKKSKKFIVALENGNVFARRDVPLHLATISGLIKFAREREIPEELIKQSIEYGFKSDKEIKDILKEKINSLIDKM